MASHKKGATGRDFAAEYAARKERAAARGLSTAQARGHAPKGESVSELRREGLITTTGGGKADTVLSRFYRAVAGMARGESLSRASKTAGIAPSTVKRLNTERDIFQPIPRYTSAGKPSGVRGYQVSYAGSTPILTREGELITGPQVDVKNASILGRYWNAVDAALQGDDRALGKFAHTTIYDVNGNPYSLMTDVNAIRVLFDRMSDADESDFWRNFYAGRTVVYAPAA